MGDDKVKESPAEVFATVTEVNSLFHSLEDMLATRFEAIDVKFGVVLEKLADMDARNEGRFAAIDDRFAAIDGRFAAIDDRFAAIDGRFAAIDGRFGALEKNLAEMDAKYEGCFEAIDYRFEGLVEKLNAMDAKNEGKFDLLEHKFISQDLKIEHSVTSTANKLMITLLVIAGSIIAGFIYGG